MTLLPFEKMLEINDIALELGFQHQRDLMLAGVHSAVRGKLPDKDGPDLQQQSDLFELNKISERIIDGSLPLERWLRAAQYGSRLYPDKQAYFRDLADSLLAAKPVVNPVGARAEAAAETVVAIKATVPEKITFVNDLLPLGFLTGATRTSKSVARLTVPRHEGGQPKMSPHSGRAIEYFGTGWLIGEAFVITNHHVVNARSNGEATAGLPDLEAQSAGTWIEFDYDDDKVPAVKLKAKRLYAYDPTLDFAILELETPSGRDPLPLYGDPITVGQDSYIPVNIIQHPGGQVKQIAIRNNLAAAIEDNKLAYFTDTMGGSSGSPVCNDQWQVLALHRASTSSMGEFTFQGKKTSWVNIGTPINLIIEHMRNRPDGLWDKIGAKLA